MQMIFSGAGIGGSQVMASSAWSGCVPRAFLGKPRQRAGRDHLAQRRIFLAEARGEIDHAIVGDIAVCGLAADGIGSDAMVTVMRYPFSPASCRRP